MISEESDDVTGRITISTSRWFKLFWTENILCCNLDAGEDGKELSKDRRYQRLYRRAGERLEDDLRVDKIIKALRYVFKYDGYQKNINVEMDTDGYEEEAHGLEKGSDDDP